MEEVMTAVFREYLFRLLVDEGLRELGRSDPSTFPFPRLRRRFERSKVFRGAGHFQRARDEIVGLCSCVKQKLV